MLPLCCCVADELNGSHFVAWTDVVYCCVFPVCVYIGL